MSMEHLKDLLYICHKECIRVAYEYDINETKRGYFNLIEDIKNRDLFPHPNGGRCSDLESATKYINYSNRPEEYKKAALTFVKELTHNGEHWIPDNQLKPIIKRALSGRLRRPSEL